MKNYFKITVHIALWVGVPFIISFFLWVFQYTVFLPGKENVLLPFWSIFKEYSVLNLLVFLIGAFGFYSTYIYLAPAFIQKKTGYQIVGILILQLLIVALISLGMGVVFFAISFFLSFFIIISYLIFTLFSVFGALLKVSDYGRLKTMENAVLVEQNLTAQLSILRTQISPHFLFNTLNNIDVLIENNPTKASEYLKSLGETLRFMLYRVDADFIPLKQEIVFLEKYISLQRIRSVNPDFVHFSVHGEANNIEVVPMIFIIFLENSFKYVASKTQSNAIEIQMDINPKFIHFSCTNSIGNNTDKEKSDGGIGLKTVRKRLALSYLDKYDLKLEKTNNRYSVGLKIDLS